MYIMSTAMCWVDVHKHRPLQQARLYTDYARNIEGLCGNHVHAPTRRRDTAGSFNARDGGQGRAGNRAGVAAQGAGRAWAATACQGGTNAEAGYLAAVC